MSLQGCWQQGLARALALTLVFSASGCLRFAHVVRPPEIDQVLTCQNVPKCCRDHVYIFMIHGMDPFDAANLDGLNKYFHNLGFNNTYYGQLYHSGAINRELRRIHGCDPESRFVLIGFSFGANMVRNITQDVKDDGISIDLLVYLGGNTLKNIPRDRPENAKRIVNILASGCIWNGAWMDDAINLHVTDVWHFGSPTHPATMQTITEELSNVAVTVPVVEEPMMRVDPFANDTPMPKPRMDPTAKRDEWDFLKPVDRLQLTFERQPDARPKAKPDLVTRTSATDK